MLAYAITGNDQFGVVDLNTGVFTDLGDMGQRLTGLAVGPGGVLYGSGYNNGSGPYNDPDFYTINPTTGALTLVGSSFSAGFYDLGSTTTAIFAIGNDGNLYSINPNTGAGTLIGPTIKGNGLSSGGSTLYMTSGSTLYTINTTTGAATLVGSSNSGAFGSDVVENSIIYGSSSDGAIYTLSSSNGAATFLSNLSGATGDFWGLAPDPTTPGQPKITGTVANQHAFPFAVIHPFAGVTISDVNTGQTETVTVAPNPSGFLHGFLFDPHAAVDGSQYQHGIYTVTGTAAQVTTDLRGLLFVAGLGETDFTIKVVDSAGASATDHTTSVLGIAPSHFGLPWAH
jgi:hypothetical protein